MSVSNSNASVLVMRLLLGLCEISHCSRDSCQVTFNLADYKVTEMVQDSTDTTRHMLVIH